jgi:hypothetical protein
MNLRAGLEAKLGDAFMGDDGDEGILPGLDLHFGVHRPGMDGGNGALELIARAGQHWGSPVLMYGRI